MHSLKDVYVEYLKLYTSIEIVYFEYTELFTYIIWKVCALNVLNCVHYLEIVYVECTELCTFKKKKMNVEYTKLSTLFEKCVN